MALCTKGIKQTKKAEENPQQTNITKDDILRASCSCPAKCKKSSTLQGTSLPSQLVITRQNGTLQY